MREFSDKYLDILTGELAGINLTRIIDRDEFFYKQILDSVLPLEKSSVMKNLIDNTQLVVDIGFGGGFPLLPLAFSLPECKFLGFEARGKKAEAVKLIAKHLGIKNAFPMHQRYEEVLFDLPAVVTFKAVGTVEDMLVLLKTTSSLTVFFYKGPSFFQLEKLDRIDSDWEIVENIDFEVPGTEGRKIIGFRNKNKIVPRGTHKRLVKLSDLI